MKSCTMLCVESMRSVRLYVVACLVVFEPDAILEHPIELRCLDKPHVPQILISQLVINKYKHISIYIK
jgi:hypothetical protein